VRAPSAPPIAQYAISTTATTAAPIPAIGGGERVAEHDDAERRGHDEVHRRDRRRDPRRAGLQRP